mmetsp:Transcript_3404/g.5455  ORF Transcript_3404/g.5455 Transcript_3404/m.5455 type:complete len:494 (+) Transcript_3404:254-1735(+)
MMDQHGADGKGADRYEFNNPTEFHKNFVDLIDSDVEEDNHAWERDLERTWENVPESRKGELKARQISIDREKRKRMKISRLENVEKGMVRYLTIILDFSKAMNSRDLKPTRKLATEKVISKFIKEYFNQNPISQLGLVIGYDRIAHKITELSGNPTQQLLNLKRVTKGYLHSGGEFSLQNTLESAIASLRHIPPYGSREILVVMGSLSTCDPGNIFETFKTLQEHKIRVSVIGLAAQMHVCKKLTECTKGRYDVVRKSSQTSSDNCYEDCVLAHVKPFGIEISSTNQQGAGTGRKIRKWIRMGFPRKKTTNYPTLCSCHDEFSYTGYFCPKCKSKSCELPTTCHICGRTLVSSQHLARCYHHLFPVNEFVEINKTPPPRPSLPQSAVATGKIKGKIDEGGADGNGVAADKRSVNNSISLNKKEGKKVQGEEEENNELLHHFWEGDCFGCQRKLNTFERVVVRCPKCNERFCVDCDIYIHESLHNCPGCLSMTM